MTDDRIHDLEPGVGSGTGADTDPGPGHVPYDGRSSAELAPESAAEGYGPATTVPGTGDRDADVDASDPDAVEAAPPVGDDADAPGAEDAGVDEVPGPHGEDDPTQNPPLPDWGPTDGRHGEG